MNPRDLDNEVPVLQRSYYAPRRACTHGDDYGCPGCVVDSAAEVVAIWEERPEMTPGGFPEDDPVWSAWCQRQESAEAQLLRAKLEMMDTVATAPLWIEEALRWYEALDARLLAETAQ